MEKIQKQVSEKEFKEFLSQYRKKHPFNHLTYHCLHNGEGKIWYDDRATIKTNNGWDMLELCKVAAEYHSYLANVDSEYFIFV